ncbi:competence type IV pilus major pilin ComGC [Listeria fleischmannii]|jgi:competence protein ComGC|uniref:ComG operon protein 3 n=2 Tax=Listeria fleischmannii TaxID=1069827 RepID=W7E1Z2_9LIST|nr:competence type IV pilus major pilin ComGC [Listeria fleischmannii]EIA20672.1 competence protein ComGC [Listeria fleischmannii subsp. coloradonensis]EUJ64394.1 general secretion pathway protein G [Listeria fleischmannii FSL S10-1203]MBC1399700.1 prepilin-type N-terminal cleavage/methylation domain-containing protein [Listeria fleischmannii]MBC1419734.1 prepilin-type N-terminal cleavage/methylation domain-containing protein [Listeria fleischmannii]MBC1428010.1 prepilin-type N-terminal cleava
MFKINWKDDRAFTLVEMLIVLLVVSVLLLLTIPNIVKQSKSINDKGCTAFISVVESQVQAYQLEFNQVPSFADLLSKGYLSEDQKSCPNGKNVRIDASGNVREE